MIQNINTGWQPTVLPPSHPYQSPGLPESSPAVAVASTTRDVDASLSITTKEGDTFSISASFDTTATYAGIRGRGEHGERGSAWSFSSSSQVSVQVQGDLNEQEMKDISRIVKTFLHDLRSMMKGGDVSVANVANGDPKSLESVSATATSNTTFTAVAGNTTPAPRELEGRHRQPLTRDKLFLRERTPMDRIVPASAQPLPAPEPVTPEPNILLA